MLRIAFACTALAATVAAVPSSAQDAERYQLERTQNGYVRLDTETGRMSLCEERSGRLVCRVAAEEREAHDRDLDALAARIEALEARIAALEAARQPSAGLPSEEEFEQTLGYMERFFRRFMGIVNDFERRGAQQPETPSDRT